MSHPVVKVLKNIPNERFYRLFDDWLELALTAHCEDEEGYMTVMRRYGPREPGKPHPADHFSTALGTIMGLMRDDNAKGELRDHLGDIYQEEAQGNKEMGQYFTPMELCKLMAELTIPPDLWDDARICDPACGSGRNLLAAIPKVGFKATYVGVDLDRTCAKMTALNLLWRNVNSYVVWGDTLRLVAHGGWATSHTALGGVIRTIDPEQAHAVLESGLRFAAQQTAEVLAAPDTRAEPQQTADARHNKRGQFEMDF